MPQCTIKVVLYDPQMHFLCLLSIEPVRKSLTWYRSQNPKFYYITVALSMQESPATFSFTSLFFVTCNSNYIPLSFSKMYRCSHPHVLSTTYMQPQCPKTIRALWKKLQMSVKFMIHALFGYLGVK